MLEKLEFWLIVKWCAEHKITDNKFEKKVTSL